MDACDCWVFDELKTGIKRSCDNIVEEQADRQSGGVATRCGYAHQTGAVHKYTVTTTTTNIKIPSYTCLCERNESVV